MIQTEEERWIRRGILLSLIAFSTLWLARWPAFPLVLDPYYHLFVAQQMVEAGGPITYEWWQYAPVGRPHLYPPVLHLLLAGLLELGWTPIAVSRWASVVLLPILLWTLASVTRRLFGPLVALTTLWMGMIPFVFHLHSVITMAATVGMIELLWLVAAIERGRTLAAGLLIALLFYTHLGMPWIALITLGVAALLRPSLRPILKQASWGLVLAIPWVWHLMVHRTLLHTVNRYENALVEVMPLLCLAAVAGAWRCWQLRGRSWWPLACWMGFTVLAPRYSYRWLSGEGMLPVILLAGVGTGWVAQRLAAVAGRGRSVIVASLLVFLVVVGSPTVAHTERGWQWVWPDSAPWHLLGFSDPSMTAHTIDTYLYSPPIQRLAETVAGRSQPNEILWSNASYAGGLVAVLSHRATSSAMLNEVKPLRALDPPAAAHLIVWFKIPPLPGTPALTDLIRRHRLEVVAEDDIALVLRNPAAGELAHTPHAVIPLWFAFMVLCGGIGLISWDWFRGGRMEAHAEG